MFPVFHRRLHKRRLRQWGNISSVRSAVVRNAEEIFGVPAESVKLAMPFWEGAGQANNYGTISAKADLVNGAVWTPRGPNSLTDNDAVDTNIPGLDLFYSESVTKHSILFDYQQTGTLSDYQYFLYSTSYEKFSLRTNTSTDYLTYGEQATSIPSGLFDGAKHTFGLTVNGTTTTAFYRDGGLLGTTAGDSAYQATGDLFINGRSDSASRQTSGVMGCCSIFYNVVLTPDQIALFNDLPYQLFAPNPAPLYFDLGAAFKPFWAYNATKTIQVGKEYV